MADVGTDTRRRPGRRAGIALAACLLASLPAAAPVAADSDWPHWRGPNRDGQSLERDVFHPGGFGLAVAWHKPLGSGYSSISITEGRAVTLTSDGEYDNVVALDAATGEELWRRRLDVTYEGRGGGSAPGPPGTPTIHDGVVYAVGPRGQLLALRLADGQELWFRKIDEQDGAKRPFYGFATSPTVVGDLLVFQTGGPGGHSVSAYDKRSGEPLWSTGDDGADYQSPLVLELAGQLQVLVVGAKYARGLRPADGQELWKIPHNATDAEGLFAQAVMVGNDRFLLNNRRTGSVLFEVHRTEGGFEASKVWQSRAFTNSYAIPVFHEGYLYGFSGDFLTCAEPVSGKIVWKSRPPGGRALILVDGHLVVFAPDGDVVVVEATPEGYREKARVTVADQSSHAPPSFADGKIYVRNLTHIAAVAVTEGVVKAMAPSAAAPVEAEEPASRFAAFVRRLEASDDKDAMLDAFMESQEQFPIVEDARLLHFVYRGEATDVAVAGSMIDIYPSDNALPMSRVPGTDFFYRTFELDANARWDYQLVVDFDEFITDPLNPLRVPERMGRGEVSEVRMPGWVVPRHLDEPSGPQGTLEAVVMKSQFLEADRELKVYLPVGYDETKGPYPLLVVTNGEQALELALMKRSLDNLVGSSVAPLIVAFVPSSIPEMTGDRAGPFTRMLAEEVMPLLEARYPISPDPAQRAVTGCFRGSVVPVAVALQHPGLFGGVAVQTLSLNTPFGEALFDLIEETPLRDVRFYVDWNHWELRSVELGIDLRDYSRRLAEALQRKGYAVEAHEALEGSGWASWRSRTDKILEMFFPMPRR